MVALYEKLIEIGWWRHPAAEMVSSIIRPGLFRTFGAAQGAGPDDVAGEMA
jgi:hypothetical protein